MPYIRGKIILGLYLTQAEGFVLGVGAKLFSIAGPVLVYGITASVAAGIIYYILMCLGWI
ncbi:MAG: SpoVA/SpoVAEb family sporulation membrane protein [Christensenellaceae bacterium]|nr:SpoVA/SpoVAEb family sporulation membrane protein [Christensenellaceae bacterium]